ncbi:hypothetical protein [Pseudomonas sp. 37 R 15]|nr:hypothetical protein [Pseudomonas sp. 37 R 15]
MLQEDFGQQGLNTPLLFFVRNISSTKQLTTLRSLSATNSFGLGMWSELPMSLLLVM